MPMDNQRSFRGRIMTTFETIISFISSGIFLALLGMFYRMGSHHTEMKLRFDRLEGEMLEVKQDIKEIKKDMSRFDREVGIITATLKFNGFDLSRHRVEGE